MTGLAAAAARAEASRGPRPAPERRLAGPVFGGAVAAAAALAAGAALAGAGVAWAPPREVGAQVLLRGAEIYAAECAGCHGARLEGQAARTRPGDAVVPPLAPPLGASGHAWRHSDAELAAIVAHGAAGDTGPDGGGMPAFAGRLSPEEIGAVLAHVKSRWPAGLRAHQAALDRGGGEPALAAPALAALLRDPAWTFPGGCLTAPTGNAGR